jgi:hypothetical protein
MCILKVNKAEKDFSHWLQYNMDKLYTLYELYEKVCSEKKQLRFEIMAKDMKISDLERKLHIKEQEIEFVKSGEICKITTL